MAKLNLTPDTYTMPVIYEIVRIDGTSRYFFSFCEADYHELLNNKDPHRGLPYPVLNMLTGDANLINPALARFAVHGGVLL